jgi:hypothetical protein
MGTLMASKLAAIFLRGTRSTGSSIYEEKGRDIYDLLWYMGKKVVPDFDYMIAKGIDVKDPKTLFDKITLKILNNPKTDENLKNDLSPLFVDPTFFTNWLRNWRESYLRLLDEYKIRTVKKLSHLKIWQDSYRNNFSFIFTYDTEGGEFIKITYIIDFYWIESKSGDLNIQINDALGKKAEFSAGWCGNLNSHLDKLVQYATLFYQKTENYFKKTNHIMLGDSIVTKVIRMTADNLNQKEHIVLNKSALLSCELDDLLK